jgi:hypothetical protein
MKLTFEDMCSAQKREKASMMIDIMYYVFAQRVILCWVYLFLRCLIFYDFLLVRY